MDNLQEPAKRHQIEYATQFFGFPPDSMVDTMIGDATDIVSSNLKAAKTQILQEFSGKVSSEELDEAFKRIEDRYTESTEKIYYKLGRYIQENVFLIPDTVLLPEDGIHAQQTSGDGSDVKAAKEGFDSLCQKIKGAKVDKVLLEGTLKGLQVVADRQEALLKQAKGLKGHIKMNEMVMKEADALEAKLKVLESLVEKIDNNVNSTLTESERAKKREFEEVDMMVAKKFKCEDSD